MKISVRKVGEGGGDNNHSPSKKSVEYGVLHIASDIDGYLE
jgi:hypothetical protein